MADLEYRSHQGGCKMCARQFTFLHRTGRYPTTCSDECRKAAVKEKFGARPKLVCAIDGCGKVAREGQQPICPMHYHRRYRTGSLDKNSPALRWINKSDGYYVVISASHPLAGKGGIVREHRAILYDALGPGPHPCHWCGTSLPWPRICVDHLNGVRSDNRPDNLVVACNGCNGSRGKLLAFIAKARPERLADIRGMMDEAISLAQPSLLAMI